jgi:hypothetical protein
MKKELAQFRQEEERQRVVHRGGSSPFSETLAGGKRLMRSCRWSGPGSTAMVVMVLSLVGAACRGNTASVEHSNAHERAASGEERRSQSDVAGAGPGATTNSPLPGCPPERVEQVCAPCAVRPRCPPMPPGSDGGELRGPDCVTEPVDCPCAYRCRD